VIEWLLIVVGSLVVLPVWFIVQDLEMEDKEKER
jgi:hypothetical protein